MSELKQYIENSLRDNFEFIEVLSKTAVNEISLYKHKDTQNILCFIKSSYRNDDVFRTLKGINTNGLLPQIYEVCSDEEYLYVLEEYVDGKTLSSILSDKKLSSNEIKSYTLDICNALDILHTKNIVHRDIKPENIIIKSNNTACLIDLSISKAINEPETKDTINLGTIGYAAPEQFGFSQSQPTTDIYALGVMINELVVGKHPSVCIPKGKFGKIVKKCTSTQISERFQSVKEIKNILQHI